MRIISGKYGGRKLVSFKADHIRPTSDRVKESLFNIIRNNLEGASVLDLFSGTGSLGLEALSRGASYVEFVELNPKSLKILKDNIELLKIDEDYKITRLDAIKFLKKYDGKEFDIILIDPPFTQKMADEVMDFLSLSKTFHNTTLIVIESSQHESIADSYNTLVCIDRRDFGDKLLSFYQRKPNS